jgi:hypothetical protein
MEPNIIDYKTEKIDRFGYVTDMSPHRMRYTMRLDNGETHIIHAPLKTPVSQGRKIMNRLFDRAEFGVVNERKEVK